MKDPARILVIRRRALGDVLVSMDVLRALRERWPQAHLGYVVDRVTAVAVQGSPLVDELIVYDRRAMGAGPVWARASAAWKWLRRLRGFRADIVVDLLSIPQTAFWSRFSGAPVRVGLRRPGRSWAYTHHVEAETQRRYAGERFLDWVRRLGIDPGSWRPQAPATRSPAGAEDEPSRTGPLPLVILNPSATWPAKAWPNEAFAKLARLLAERCEVRVAWGPGEECSRDAIVDAAAGAAEALPPTDLAELAGWLQRASVLVTTDSGPKHVAVGVGTPTLTLFGSTDPVGWQPPGDEHRGVGYPADCAPCDLTVCNVEGHPCLDLLKAETVANEVFAMIQADGGQHA